MKMFTFFMKMLDFLSFRDFLYNFLMIHNSINFPIIRVEPAQAIFFSAIWVDLAQLDKFFKHPR